MIIVISDKFKGSFCIVEIFHGNCSVGVFSTKMLLFLLLSFDAILPIRFEDLNLIFLTRISSLIHIWKQMKTGSRHTMNSD